MYLFGYKLPGMSSLLIWGLLWEIAGQMEVSFFLPALSAIFSTLLEIYHTKVFLRALYETGYSFCAGVYCSLVPSSKKAGGASVRQSAQLKTGIKRIRKSSFLI